METKKCQFCKGEITGKREDAKFCSNTCKAKHWEEKKLAAAKEEKNVAYQLRGALNNHNMNIANPTNQKPNSDSKINPLPKAVLKMEELQTINLSRAALFIEQRRLLDAKKALETNIQSLQSKLQNPNSLKGSTWVTSLSGAGALLGSTATEKKLLGLLVGATLGNITGRLIQDATQNIKENNVNGNEEQIRKEIQNGQKLIQAVEKELKEIEIKIKGKPVFETIKTQLKTLDSKPKPTLGKKPAGLGLPDLETVKPSPRLPTDGNDSAALPTNSNKIISSVKLDELECIVLLFQGKWYHFFGNPSHNFHLALTGMSGEGKSTFAIIFAKYLADNFGRVIYISGEEGFSKTFQDKFSNNNAASQFLDVADLRTYEDIIREVPADIYNFIFIDSLDNMKIDAAKMKLLREHYKNSALITISQSTKDGKMRGSYEIVHDSDIRVDVVNCIATTMKNRFKEKGMILSVFEK